MTHPSVRTSNRQCEVAWFSALCGDDYEFLGIPDDRLRSSYERASEIIQILQGLWNTDGPFEWIGKHYQFNLPNTEAAKPYQQNGGPLMYFGGISPPAQDLCAKHCDVFLMWPETEERVAGTIQVMSDKAAKFNRKIDFGFRSHVIVRETEAEARAAADRLISKLDVAKGQEIKNKSLDSQSAGVLRQDASYKIQSRH